MILHFEYLTFLLAFLLPMTMALILIPKIIVFVQKQQWLDLPNERSSHIDITPSMGGLSFATALVLALVCSVFDHEISLLIGCSFVFMIMGALDDTRDLSAKLKLGVQLATATVLYGSGFDLAELHGLLGIGALPRVVSFLLTLLVIAGVTNAFNLIDGINGLAGGIGAINCLVFSLLFYLIEEFNYALLFLAMAGSLIGFLRFNFSPARIFMGDTGSLTVGGLLAAGLLKIWSVGDPLFITVATATVIFPCLDMLRLFVSRILRGGSPFVADKNHFHHLLLKTGYDHVRSSLSCYLIQAILLLVAMVLGKSLHLTPALITTLLMGILTYAIVEFRFYIKALLAGRLCKEKITYEIESNSLIRSLWKA